MAFQLVVDFIVGSGPTCTLTQSKEGTGITCSITYADFPIAPMNPVITCTVDGRVYNATNPASRTSIDPKYYVYESTTVINISNSSAPTYDCRLTFDPPDLENNPNYDYVVTSKPNFTANITGERRRVEQIITYVYELLKKIFTESDNQRQNTNIGSIRHIGIIIIILYNFK